MKLLVYESAVELLALLGSVIGAAVVTIAGMATEQAGIQNVLAGHVALGAWEIWMGTAALFVGLYLFGYREFWRRLRRMRS